MKFWVDRLEDEKDMEGEVVIDSMEELMAFFEEEGDFLITRGDTGRPGLVVYGAYEENAKLTSSTYKNFDPPEDLEYEVEVEELG